MPRSINDLLYGAASSDEDYAGDSSSNEGDESEGEYADDDLARLQAVVHVANTPTFRPIAGAAADDDDVQILTAAEAAAEVAAAARRAVQDPNASRKRKRPTVETRAEPTECTICCEECTLVGRHRLVALKCGHLFGRKCIERWISERRTCPNCSALVRRTDIRLLFSDHVAVVDNSGLEDMTSKFEEEKKKSCKLEREVEALKQQLVTKTGEAARLNADLISFKKAVADLRCKEPLQLQRRANAAALASGGGLAVPAAVCVASVSVSSATPARQGAVQVTQSQTASHVANRSEEPPLRYSQSPVVSTSQPAPELGSDAFTAAVHKYKPIFDVPLLGARVFSIARSCRFLCVGEDLAHGPHGILMLNCWDPTRGVRVPVHSSDVRDICIHPSEQYVLTVAFDGKLAVTSPHQQKVALQIELPSGRRQGWACSFSGTDPYAIYCGFQDGTVAKYDYRKPTAGEQAIVKTFSLPERQPVHSIKVFKNPEGTEGLAAATFRGLSVWKDVGDVASDANRPVGNGSVGATPIFHVPSDQACFSLASNQLESSQVVVSSRSTPTKHSAFDLRTIGTGRLAPRMEFVGHKAPSVLSRSAMWSEAYGASVVASWSQDIERVTLWNVATHREVRGPEPASLSVASAAMPVVDIQHAVAKNSWSSGVALLGTMTARQLCVYRSGG
ncbi:hypothetical protein PHYPSEUDO_013408 [Phytophthora pseudosyringae]|uniref:RING-type domain-containing protein n=1 Tax=Phytophthora pseudosyringae TaxID=221518 RepID=A0A8T1WLQ4_9STRA|nr:hypothetical protein PHYPSEUDO_013408 [Phytophthora pseudosyringae]